MHFVVGIVVYNGSTIAAHFTEPAGLQGTDISIEVSHMNGLSVTLRFNVSWNQHPCSL